jgi:flagellar biosynthesis GTPase FlhF
MDGGDRVNAVQIRSAERALSVGTWLIVAGAMLYSILTVTPLAAAHTPDKWKWTAPILPLVVDAAVVIVVRLDAVLARLGGHGGKWPIVLRWMTGCMTLALNVADSALHNDLVGVAVHAVAPLLLIVTAETGLAYRRAIAAAVTELETRQRAQREARERVIAERRETAARLAREEREHAALLAREQREHEARLIREQVEREEAVRREERQQTAAREQAEREARERAEREREQQARERERREREAAERAEQERAARAERERAALLAAGPAVEKLPEDRARSTVQAAFEVGLPVRSAAELCGWSVGWVSTRYQEFRDAGHPAREHEPVEVVA